MRLLLTRPREDADGLAAKLAALGHEAVIAPMMEIRFRDGPPIQAAGVQALLATSANGVRGFSRRCADRSLPVFAVGPQSTEAAQAAGFRDVINANGDSTALAALVAERAAPGKGRLLHAAGVETAGRLSESLNARGFDIETVVLYEAAPVEMLSVEAAAALREDVLDGVMLFSPRSAAILTQLVSDAGLAPRCRRLTAFCISAATAVALAPLGFPRTAVAAKPNQQAMLDLVASSG